MSSAGYEQFDLIDRPDAAALEVIRRSRTAVVSDSLNALNIRHHVIRGAQRLSGPAVREVVVGPAITIDFAPIGDSGGLADAPYLASRVIDRARAGDVVVVSTRGAVHAFWGEHMAQHAQRRGVAGAILDGYVRDVGAIRALEFPIFARGATPDTLLPHYEAVGYNCRIVCGDAPVAAGDIVVADDDGAVVIPQGSVAAVIADVERRQALEEWADEAASAGANPLSIYDRIYRDGWRPESDPAS